MLQYDFSESVGCWIGLTSHAIRRALDAELARENITLRQWEVLAHIAYEGNPSQVELAEKLGIEAPTLAGILARMERDGWLDRYACPEDRRRKRLKPTPRAEQVWNRMVECCHRVRELAIGGLTPEELLQLRVTCEKIRDNLGNPCENAANPAGDECGQGILSEGEADADSEAGADSEGDEPAVVRESDSAAKLPTGKDTPASSSLSAAKPKRAAADV